MSRYSPLPVATVEAINAITQRAPSGDLPSSQSAPSLVIIGYFEAKGWVQGKTTRKDVRVRVEGAGAMSVRAEKRGTTAVVESKG